MWPFRWLKRPWPVWVIIWSRAIAIGMAYLTVANRPGVASSFVAILSALIPFDLLVAAPRLRFTGVAMRENWRWMHPRMVGTAEALLKGVSIGAAFGIAGRLGLPLQIAAILAGGLAYTAAEETKGSISTYVGLIGGLTVFQRIVQTQMVENLWLEMATEIWVTFWGTGSALVLGWTMGILVGILTRVMLPRGYRTLKSPAYDRPLEHQPFSKVIDYENNLSAEMVTIEPGAALDGKYLRDTRIHEELEMVILGIYRGRDHLVLPGGSQMLMAGDRILVFGPRSRRQELLELVGVQRGGVQVE